jgi:hypothetical protein
MKLVWSPEELVEHWSVEPEVRANIPDTVGESGCLGFVAQLTFYRLWARFPDGRADFAPTVLSHLAEQLAISEVTIASYDWNVGPAGATLGRDDVQRRLIEVGALTRSGGAR